MKRILFCFIVLLAFSLSANSLASRVQHAHHSGIVPVYLSIKKEELQKSSGNYFCAIPIDLTDDDSNDTEEEIGCFKTSSFETTHAVSPELHNLYLKRVYYNKYFSAQAVPFFILLSVLRI